MNGAAVAPRERANKTSVHDVRADLVARAHIERDCITEDRARNKSINASIGVIHRCVKAPDAPMMSLLISRMADLLRALFQRKNESYMNMHAWLLMEVYEPIIAKSADPDLISLSNLASLLVDVIQDQLDANRTAITTVSGQRCGYCSKIVEYRGRHINMVHREERAVVPQTILDPKAPGPRCEHCKMICVNAAAFKEHSRFCSADSALLSCPLCKTPPMTSFRLCSHIEKYHKNIRFPLYSCLACSQYFGDFAGLEAHWKSVKCKGGLGAPPVDKIRRCLEEAKEPMAMSFLSEERKRGKGRKEVAQVPKSVHSCPLCRATSMTPYALCRHVENFHGKMPFPLYACSECPVQFDDYVSLDVHWMSKQCNGILVLPPLDRIRESGQVLPVGGPPDKKALIARAMRADSKSAKEKAMAGTPYAAPMNETVGSVLRTLHKSRTASATAVISEPSCSRPIRSIGVLKPTPIQPVEAPHLKRPNPDLGYGECLNDPVDCQMCSNTLESMYALAEHFLTHHPNLRHKIKFICRGCNNVYKTLSLLELHANEMEMEGRLICSNRADVLSREEIMAGRALQDWEVEQIINAEAEGVMANEDVMYGGPQVKIARVEMPSGSNAEEAVKEEPVDTEYEEVIQDSCPLDEVKEEIEEPLSQDVVKEEDEGNVPLLPYRATMRRTTT